MKTAEEFFQSKNGGKDSRTMLEHDENYTPVYWVKLMQEYGEAIHADGGTAGLDEIHKEAERIYGDMNISADQRLIAKGAFIAGARRFTRSQDTPTDEEKPKYRLPVFKAIRDAANEYWRKLPSNKSYACKDFIAGAEWALSEIKKQGQ